MNISLSWLQRHVTLLEKNPSRIAEILTEKSAEVDAIHSSYDSLQTVVTGKLLSFQKISDNSKLHKGIFSLGNIYGEKVVVFGSVFPLQEQEVYAIALPGTHLFNGGIIEVSKLGGISSEGMVCSEEELGISYTQEGLLRFPSSTPLGVPVMDIIRAGLHHVVVGKIKEISLHPNAERLHLVKVEIENGEILNIVCGGSNLQQDALVPVACVGANLWGDFKIKASQIRGEESNGMICSTEELHIAPSQNKEIFLLQKPAPLGTPFFHYIFEEDIVFEVENTAITNRPDLFSHIGFARELVACGLAKWKEDSVRDVVCNIPTENTPLPISISFPTNAEKIVPEYLAVSINGVDGKTQSPPEMQRLLKSVGIQPHNALVDITNFVMFDTGMPLHAFDRERVGKKWNFELTTGGEKMVNLDGDEKILPPHSIILRDELGTIFDCCGIQGGKNSGIVDSTTNVLLHAPVYDAVKIRRTAIAIGHRTDAATIYEKGIALPVAEKGLFSAINWILEIFPEAKITSEIFHKTFGDLSCKHILVPHKTITRVLGHTLSADEILKILNSLEIFGEWDGGILNLTIPEWRTDLNIPEDIAEEIARIYGLNNIHAVSPHIEVSEYQTLPIRAVEKKVAQVLVSNGFFEVITFSFLGEKLLSRCGIEKDEENMIFLKNPLSEDVSLMRTSLSPRLFETAEKNRRYQEKFRIFESGKVFKMKEGEKKEEDRITALFVGDDFYNAKAIAEEIFESFGIPTRTESKDFSSLPFVHPGRCAVVKGGKDAVIKILQIHPKIAKEFHLPENTCEVCITLAPFTEFLGKVKKIKSIPRFPGVQYDVSVLCDTRLPVENLVKNFEKINLLVTSAKIMDIWEGKGLEEGKKSVTVSFEFRSSERTLEEKEIKILEKTVLETLEKRGGVFRFGE